MKGLVRPAAKRAGQPDWLLTFADLMTLLLTFFVLLLSFSEMDVEKYRAMAASMGEAFGVTFIESSQQVPVITVAEKPEEVPPAPVAPPPSIPALVPGGLPQPNTEVSERVSEDSALNYERNDALATRLITEMEDFMADGLVDVAYDDREVVMRFSEKATFSPGSAELQVDIKELLSKVVGVLKDCTGHIQVVGHTDDRPILQGRFRSNWDLSSARAVSVVHEMVLDGSLDAKRVEAVGRAETQPLEPNDTEAQRARNRRVEIHILNAICDNKTEQPEQENSQ